jgi:hypothetical protein
MGKLLRIHPSMYRRCLQELVDAKVLKVDENGMVYSLRVLSDCEKRARAREYGKKGGNPALVGDGVKAGVNPTVKADKKREEKRRKETYSAAFATLKQHYPERKGGQNYPGAATGYEKALERKTTTEGNPITEASVLAAVKLYRQEAHDLNLIGTEHVMMMSTFFGRDCRYEEYIDKSAEAEKLSQRTREATQRREEYLASRQPAPPPVENPDPEGAAKARAELRKLVGGVADSMTPKGEA